MPAWKKFDVSEEELSSSPRLLLITNLSTDTTETQVRDFFSICGDVREIELARSDRKLNELEALVLFQTESAAKSADALDGMIINNRYITVKPYSQSGRGSGQLAVQREHSKYAEYLASGVLKAQDIDARYKVLHRVSDLTNSLYFWDQVIGVSSKAYQVADYLNLKHHVETAVTIATVVGEKALETGVGKKVQSAFETVKENITDLAVDTQAVLEEKRIQDANANQTVRMDSVDDLEDEAISLSLS
ncbi:hypothetical protein HK104_008440 [Borealophlyctis nickersoniae]|nr:hypothetical protein HK104_008440 [Borealophlyctis nickersoniae]